MSWARLLVAELRKALTLPGVWAGVATAVLGSLALAWLNAGTGEAQNAFQTGILAIPVLGTAGGLVVGVVVMGSEYARDRAELGGSAQITTTLASHPSRLGWFAGKIITVCLLVGLTVVVAVAGSTALARVHGARLPAEAWSDMVRWGGGACLYVTLVALMGMAITTLVRDGTVPLTLLLVNFTVVSVSYQLTRISDAAHFLPDMAGRSLLPPDFQDRVVLSPWEGAAVMTGWTVVLLAVAGAWFCRKDA